MADPLTAVARQVQFQTGCLEKIAGNLEGEQWLYRLDGSSNAAWIVGHIAVYRHVLARQLGAALAELDYAERYRFGTTTPETLDPPVERMLGDVKAAGEAIAERLPHLTNEQLAEPYGRRLPIGEVNRAEAVQFLLLFHENYHLGQMAMLVRAQGKQPLKG
jgi:uncharacterized damage-inducible protein DinB